MQLAIVDKRRQKANQCEVMNVIGDVSGKDCIIFDEMCIRDRTYFTPRSLSISAETSPV